MTRFFRFLTILVPTFLILIPLGVNAQDDSTGVDPIDMNYTKPEETHFMVVGLTTFGFVDSKSTTNGATQKTNTVDGDNYEFSPMFLWRHNSNVLFEFEPSFTGGSTLGVNWADVSYVAAPGLIIRAGYFVLPFGNYTKRLAAGWIDKLAVDPQGNGPAGSDFGIEVEGGLPLGSAKMNYDISLTNGLQLQADGSLQNVGLSDNNNNKTVCGRIGFLPLSNSSLEIGLSGLVGNVGDAGTPNEAIKTEMYAVDLSYVKRIHKVLLNVKGQFTSVNVDKNNYVNPTDSTQTFTFNNVTTQLFAQASIRPVGLDNKILKNFELAYRYSYYNTPAGAAWQQNYTENDFGIDYWFTWRTVLKFTYAMMNSVVNNNAAIGVSNSNTTTNNMYLQFSVQF